MEQHSNGFPLVGYVRLRTIGQLVFKGCCHRHSGAAGTIEFKISWFSVPLLISIII
ncbi:Ribosomal protein L18ae family [Zea mays]|jgi:hypothetical protein|uniref:Ribosomal protein L18ae family n=1 Tax=Zea mays TaxID=4577 RepID=A0A1D6FG94_MAIZE|nr:Ribosomal protein L18ae family [Zea mays]